MTYRAIVRQETLTDGSTVFNVWLIGDDNVDALGLPLVCAYDERAAEDCKDSINKALHNATFPEYA